jgi:hypothetical protein
MPETVDRYEVTWWETGLPRYVAEERTLILEGKDAAEFAALLAKADFFHLPPQELAGPAIPDARSFGITVKHGGQAHELNFGARSATPGLLDIVEWLRRHKG